ncbi:hypothetical protein F5Y12DRAFT_28515 [Xylaria sp. FL1777]|nr:hypothetical protein F5Y12DRAFT_28515 [Xylaria sp. FL1777]
MLFPLRHSVGRDAFIFPFKCFYFACLISFPLQLVTAHHYFHVKHSQMNNLPLAARDTVTLTLAQPQATLLVSTPSGSESSTAFQTSTIVQAITLTLAIFSFVLTAVTYWLLLKYSARLSNQVVIPTKFLRGNMNRVLQQLGKTERDGVIYELRARDSLCELYTRGTPGDPSWEQVGGRCQWKKLRNPVRRFLKTSSLPPQPDSVQLMREQDLLAVPAGSPAMKSIVQASIWEWVAVWLALIALVNTLTYNGFLTGDNTPDMVLRLILVSIYAGAVVGHALYVTHFSIYQILTSLVFQATWEVLTRTFSVVRYSPAWEKDGQAVTFEGILMGETKAKELMHKQADILSSDVNIVALPLKPSHLSHHVESLLNAGNRESVKSFFDSPEVIESMLEKKIKPVLESEVKVFEKAAEASLERTLASIAVLLGVCLATGLSPFTSIISVDATSAQLGSYALLLSVTTGIFALTSSLSHFSTMVDSARMLLRLKEYTLSARGNEHLDPEEVRGWDQFKAPRFGFSDGLPKGINGYPVTTTGLLHSMTRKQLCGSVFLGPVLPFLPVHPARRTEDAIELQVDDVKLVWSSHGVYKSPDRATHIGNTKIQPVPSG